MSRARRRHTAACPQPSSALSHSQDKGRQGAALLSRAKAPPLGGAALLLLSFKLCSPQN